MSARVKHFSGALLHALREERHFALLDGLAFSNPRLARNCFQVRTQSDPCISSVATQDHDYYFELLREEERDAQSIPRCSTAHHGDFPSSPHHQMEILEMEILAAPLRKAAHRHLRRFHQQKTHHRTPLFGDVAQPSSIATGIFQWH